MNRWTPLLLASLLACAEEPPMQPPVEQPEEPPPVTVWSQARRSGELGVELRPTQVTEEHVELEAVAWGLEDLYGVAFRLELDPEALAVESLEAAGEWSPALVQTATPRPGLFVAGLSLRGSGLYSHESDEELRLWRMRLRRLDPRRASQLTFIAEKSAVLYPIVGPIPGVVFSAGAFVPPP